MATICSSYPAPATGLLQGLRCGGYAASVMLHMLQLLHWPHRSACFNCCIGVLLYCCIALYPVYGVLYLLFRGRKPRTAAATAPTISTISTNPGTLVFTKANGHHLLPCPAPAAGLLQGLRCRGYAARALLHMLQLQHWPHRSACANFCTCHTDRHAPTAALATKISMPQVLHWPHRSACPKCCTGHTDQHAPTAALATRISMLDMNCCSTL